MPSKPNVLIVVLDTLRYANCSCYGYDRRTTPTLERVAEEGRLYTNAVSPAPWTLPAHVSLFTGQFCYQHGVDGRSLNLGTEEVLLAELLAQAGYATVAVSSNTWISNNFGFDRGFHEFYKTWQIFQDETRSVDLMRMGQPSKKGERAVGMLRSKSPKTIINTVYGKYLANRYDDGSRRVSDTAIQWLKQTSAQADRDEPFFMFLNYLDPHSPYLPPKDARRVFADKTFSDDEYKRLSSISVSAKEYHMGQLDISNQEFIALHTLYDEEILYTDRQLGRLLDHMRETNILDDTLVIIIGDHGENIGDHGLMAHRFSLNQTLVHVPFLVRYPAAFESRGVEERYVQLTDIMPTVLSATGLEDQVADLGLLGEDLLGGRPPTDRPILSEYLSTSYTPEARSDTYDFEHSRHNRLLRALYDGNYKLIETLGSGDCELYDLADDPDEQHNIASQMPDKVKAIKESAERFFGDFGDTLDDEVSTTGIDPAVQERLMSLGYLE